MGTLDYVISMKSQGASEEDIIRNLSENGISPKEIEDSLNQAQIKSAVSDIQGDDDDDEYISRDVIQPPTLIKGNIKPSFQENQSSNNQITSEEQNYKPLESYASMPMETQPYYSQQPNQTTGYEQYLPQDANYQNYDQSQYGYDQTQNFENYDSNSMMDLAEQIIEDKLVVMRSQMNDLNEFKQVIEAQLENVEERLRKIETIIDNLQLSILEKVGSYGQNLNSIRKEMEMMQDSFSKVIDPLTDKISQDKKRK